MNTMKAIIKQKNGVFLKDIPKPTPGPSDILVKVAVVGYCRTDGYVAQNKIQSKKLPLVLGHEFYGTIEACGKKVKNFKKGDRVAIMPIMKDSHGHYSGPMLGVEHDGAFAEYVITPAASVHIIPATMTFREAAYLEPVTASLAVLKAPIKKDQRGLILGKNRIAVLTQRILTIHGFQKAKLFTQTELGSIRANSYDYAIETLITTDTLTELIRVVRPGGLIILKSRQYTPIELSVASVVRKDIRLFGTYYGDFEKSIRLIAHKKLKVSDIFGATLSLHEALKILKGPLDTFEEKKMFFDPSLCVE
ncbi:MAG: alcohol dehydrogenase catalytic domain-containing protein [bacterium]|nr:alcohol dehydrogenase catalytic domain-containing protein [bacterium]